MANLIRRNPGLALSVVRPYSVLDEVDRMMSEFWPTDFYHYTPGDFLPLNMWEEKGELVVRMEVPGIKKEDIDISLDGSVLTIKAERKQEELSEDSTCYVGERFFGKYTRSVSLPFPVNAEKVSTCFENGILEIRLPKTEEAKAKHIQIKGGTQKALPSKTK